MKPFLFRAMNCWKNQILTCTAFPLVLFLLIAGCKSGEKTDNRTVLAFRTEIQARIDTYSPPLALSLASNDRKDITLKLKALYAEPVTSVKANNLLAAVLDSHGVTVASQSTVELDGAKNYGHYHIVTRVLQKQKPLQSSLYLQGDRKVFIICSPLQYRKKLVGVLVIGIDAEEILRAGISEHDFMYIDFATRGGISR